VNRITKLKTKTNDILVSFDIVSLFTNVPVQDTLDIIKKSENIDSNFFPLIEHCLTSTYFQFQGEFYEQTSGAAMGSPISPIIANIFMEHFENEVLKNAPLKPSTWFRYVDDTFVIWSHGRETLPQFLDFLNSQHRNIQFTMEIEQNNQLPFLDVLVKKNEDGTLGHRVYRKPTHTDRYLHATSHHHPTQKNSVISSLIYRALTISEPTSLNEELEHLNQVLTKNGYKSKDIHRTTERLKNKISNSTNMNTSSEKEEEKEVKKWTILPYLQGTTERISRILGKHNIKVIFKPQNKIAQLLPNPKDSRPHLETPGVYRIPCSCGKVYIGETGRKISTRIKEHQRSAKYCHFSQSALAEHWMETGHSVQYDKATRLAPSQSYFARKHREALEILKHPDNLNRDKGYQTNPIWHTALNIHSHH
jgi:hypothetical protein